jgi:putative phosphoesterase
MKIAYISDIHANYPALARALEVAERMKADRVIAGGDLVGSGPHPVEVIRYLRERNIPSVRGNIDRRVIEAGTARKVLEKRVRKRGSHIAWTALQLGEEERAFLAALPGELRIEVFGRKILLVHGSPRGDTDYIYPSITAKALRTKLGDETPDLLISGHSHLPFTRTVADIRVVNCGSAGKPIDGDPRGSMALVEVSDAGRIQSRILRFAYPLDGLRRDLERRGLDSVTAREFETGLPKGAP